MQCACKIEKLMLKINPTEHNTCLLSLVVMQISFMTEILTQKGITCRHMAINDCHDQSKTSKMEYEPNIRGNVIQCCLNRFKTKKYIFWTPDT